MTDDNVRVLVCNCGCGQTFTQTRVGRVRKYLNNAHKSAANNERTRQAVKRGKSVKDAVLLRHICDDMQTEDIAAWFPDLSEKHWMVIDAIRNTPITYDAFMSALVEMAGW